MPNGISITVVMQAEHQGIYTDLLTWGTESADHGCISLRLSPDGNFEYGEKPPKDSGLEQVWQFVVAEPALRLDDGEWHRITVARSAFNIVYLYENAKPVAQAVMAGNLPSSNNAKELSFAATSKRCEDEPDEPRPFVGVLGGFRIYDVALSAPQVLSLPMEREE